MIRRTVARAFGLSGDDRPSMEKAAPAGNPGSRIQILNTLFTELAEALEKAARERSAGEASPAGGGEPRYRVTKPHPRPEGLEFNVETPAGSYRFLNPMGGVARVYREDGGRLREDRLISIAFDEGRPRAIEKTSGAARAPFRYTSVPALVREVVGEPSR